MNENDRTTLEQAIYEEMELTPEMIRSIRTLCGVCLCSFINPRRSKSPLFPRRPEHGHLHCLPDPARS